MLKILWKRGEIAPEEQFLLLSTIFCYLMLDFYVKTGIRFSLRDKRLIEITEVEITRVNCMLKNQILVDLYFSDLCLIYQKKKISNQQISVFYRIIKSLIIYLKRFPFTLHWSNRAIFSAYCTESSAYCAELRSHVH